MAASDTVAAPTGATTKGRSAPTASSVRPPVFRRPALPYLRILVVLAIVAMWREFRTEGLADADLMNRWLYLTIIVIGFFFVFGVSGQFAFSQAAFAGLGAYVSAWQSREGNSFLHGVIVSLMIAAVVSGLFSLLVRRAAHFYFAIATLAISEIMLLVVRTSRTLQGPNAGELSNVPPISIFGYDFTEEATNRRGEPSGIIITSSYKIFWLLLGAVAVCLIAGTLLHRSSVVREAIAVRDHEVVSSTLGLPVLRIRVTMYVLGSCVAAGAGAFYVHWKGSASPEQFGVDLGLAIFLMLILGGMGSMWGAVLGAWFYVYVEHFMRDLSRYWPLVWGSALVIVMVLLPDGLIGTVQRIRDLRGGRAGQVRVPNWALRFFDAPQAPTIADPADPTMRTDHPALAKAGAVAPSERPPVTDEVILAADGISVSFGGVRAVSDVSLELHRGEVLGLIGPNGSGKSTFLNAVTGVVPASGTLRAFGRQITLGRPPQIRAAGILRTYQTPQTFGDLTCIENTLLAMPRRTRTGIFSAWFLRPLVLRDEHNRWQRAGEALERVGLLDRAEVLAANLSYGQRRMLELARTIAAEPAVVLLDEPSAGLNAAETDVLAAHLERLRADGVSLLIVDHKIDFISSLCDRVAVLELGHKVAEGDPIGIWEDQRVVDAYLGVTEDDPDAHDDTATETGTAAGTDVVPTTPDAEPTASPAGGER